MGFYAERVLPRAVDTALRGRVFAQLRERAAADLEGEVLIADADLELARLDTVYMRGPKALGYMSEGFAVKAR